MAHPEIVAALVATVMLLWLALSVEGGHDPRDFSIINRATVARCHASSVIRVDPNYRYAPPHASYDGAFYYLIALDPLHAACYLDTPSYRYTRILYPLAARLLALGQIDWVPVTLVMVNVLALAGGTLVVASWLYRQALSPWLSLVYGLYPGLFVSVWRDLTEPLSYALVALAVYLFDFGGKRRVLWAGCCFGLAALARETAVIFAVAYGLTLLWRRPRRGGVAFLLLALVPIAGYKVLLRVLLGTNKILQPAATPFGGLLHYWPWKGEQFDLVLAVVLPALICAGMAVWALLQRAWTREAFSVLLNVLILVILLPGSTYAEYYAAGRATSGVVLAALLCVPVLDQVTRRRRTWLWVAASLWLLPWYTLVPAALTWADPKI